MGAEGGGINRGSRDNGLRCAGYTPVADLDPRIADALLDALRDEGIAAYAAPTPAASGGYGELRLPTRPMDRLWVDDAQIERARELVAAETDPPPPAEEMVTDRSTASGPIPGDPDFDTAWQQVLSSLRTPTSAATSRPWPTSEEVDPSRRYDDESAAPTTDATGLDVADAGFDPYDIDDHYEPPEPPPLPKFRSATVGAIVAIALGILVLVTNYDGGGWRYIAFFAIIGGGASLVWNMRQGPPDDSGWDDGAVV